MMSSWHSMTREGTGDSAGMSWPGSVGTASAPSCGSLGPACHWAGARKGVTTSSQDCGGHLGCR